MRIPRFFVDQTLHDTEELIIADKDIIHQVKNVLRLKEGDEVIFLDESGGLYHSRVKVLLKEKSNFSKIVFTRYTHEPALENKPKLNLVTSIIKKDKYEWVLQKGTEIGVSQFSPIISEYTEKVNIDMKRAQKIIKEAAEQSGRVFLPLISEPVSLEEILEKCKTTIIVLEVEGESLQDTFPQIKSEKELAVLVGPEGGWSQKELKLFKSKNIPIYAFGKNILEQRQLPLQLAQFYCLADLFYLKV